MYFREIFGNCSSLNKKYFSSLDLASYFLSL